MVFDFVSYCATLRLRALAVWRGHPVGSARPFVAGPRPDSGPCFNPVHSPWLPALWLGFAALNAAAGYRCFRMQIPLFDSYLRSIVALADNWWIF